MITLIVMLVFLAIILFVGGIALACWPLLIPLALDVCVILLLIRRRRTNKVG